VVKLYPVYLLAKKARVHPQWTRSGHSVVSTADLTDVDHARKASNGIQEEM
jgi:hypothetical protein